MALPNTDTSNVNCPFYNEVIKNERILFVSDIARMFKKAESTIHTWQKRKFKKIPLIKKDRGALHAKYRELKSWAERNNIHYVEPF